MSLQESDLRELLNDPKVRDSIHLWKEVGLELGIKKSRLEVIAKDHPLQTEECNKEMLVTWLRNFEDPYIEHLHQAIDRVNERHQREEERKRTTDEEEEALAAIEQVKTLLQRWEDRNKKIAGDNESFQEELRKEEQWLSTARKWKQEEDEWQQGEEATRRKNLEEALHHRNFKSRFVENFVRSKNIQLSDLNDKGVEGLLRQGLMEIENSRSMTLITRFRKTKEHYDRLQHLRQEIIESNKLIDERLQAYDKIKRGLEEAGVKQSKIAELNEQLQKLKRTAEEFIRVRENIDNIYQEEQENFDRWEEKMRIHIESFDNHIKDMTEKQSAFLTALFAIIETAGGAFVGALGGATVGTAVAPVLGTAVGALVGFVMGATTMTVSHQQSRDEREQKEKRMQNEAQKYKETLLHAQKIQKKLQDLLD